MDVRLPDGTLIKGVPDNITKAELVSKLKANGMDTSGLEPAPAQEPGWFEPGSKSEAAVRGFSQGATLGYGDEIQAAIRAGIDKISGDKRPVTDIYTQLRDEERAANKAAQEANPKSYGAPEVIASMPAYMAGGAGAGTIKGAAATTAAVSGVQGAGTAEGSVEEQAKEAALSAIVGGATGAAGAKVAQVLPSVIKAAPAVISKGLPAAKKAGWEAGYKEAKEWIGATGTGKMVRDAIGITRGETPTMSEVIKPAIAHSGWFGQPIGPAIAGGAVAGKAASAGWQAGKKATQQALKLEEKKFSPGSIMFNEGKSTLPSKTASTPIFEEGKPVWQGIMNMIKGKPGQDEMKTAQQIFVANQTNPEARAAITAATPEQAIPKEVSSKIVDTAKTKEIPAEVSRADDIIAMIRNRSKEKEAAKKAEIDKLLGRDSTGTTGIPPQVTTTPSSAIPEEQSLTDMIKTATEVRPWEVRATPEELKKMGKEMSKNKLQSEKDPEMVARGQLLALQRQLQNENSPFRRKIIENQIERLESKY